MTIDTGLKINNKKKIYIYTVYIQNRLNKMFQTLFNAQKTNANTFKKYNIRQESINNESLRGQLVLYIQ